MREAQTALAASRDVGAFQRAYDEHGPAVYAAAYRVLGDAARAQDVAQDVFLGLWRRPDRYEPARGDLAGYLKLIARSRALDMWRERQVAQRAHDRLRARVAVEQALAEDALISSLVRRHARSSVLRALLRLPAPQREAIVMVYWGGLTGDQIAERTGAPLGTIKSRIRLGLLRLRDECEPEVADLRLAA